MVVGAQTSPVPPGILAEMLDWWRNEVLGLVNRRPKTVAAAIEFAPDITIVRGGVLLGASEEISPIGAIRGVAQARPKRGLHIRLEANRGLIRRLADHRIPLCRAHRMAELDVSANTPFDIKDVLILFCKIDPMRHQSTEYLVVRRDIIEPVLAQVRAAKGKIGVLTAGDGTSTRIVDDYVVDCFNGSNRILRALLKNLFWLTAATLACIGIYNSMMAIDAAAKAVETKIEMLEPTAVKARAAFKKRAEHLARLQSLYRDRQNYRPLVTTLEELSLILPDNSYLTTFSKQKDKIRISGFSASAANLVSSIDASPLFKSPRFSSAIVKAPGRNGEQFNMEIDLEHAD